MQIDLYKFLDRVSRALLFLTTDDLVTTTWPSGRGQNKIRHAWTAPKTFSIQRHTHRLNLIAGVGAVPVAALAIDKAR